MKKRIYVMPQSFIEDPDVPARWRVWGVLNGFFVNGEKCWASNEWIGERLGIHKDTVSYAVKELEEMGLVRCERTRRSRLITLILKEPEIGTQTDQDPPPGPISDRHIDLSNRVSNSVSLITGEAPLRIESYSDEDKPRREKKDTTYLKVFELWGKYPLNWKANRTEIAAAQNILAEHTLKEAANALAYAKENADIEKCPQMLKPSDLDRKWVNLQAFRDRL